MLKQYNLYQKMEMLLVYNKINHKKRHCKKNKHDGMLIIIITHYNNPPSKSFAIVPAQECGIFSRYS